MDSAAPVSVEKPRRRSFSQWLRDMPQWKKIAVGLAILMAVVGAIGMIAQGDAATTLPADGRSDLTADFVNGAQEPRPPQAAPAEEPAAKGVFRLGFSFFAGFCIGSFLRTALRFVAVAVGFWLVMTIVLGHYGLVVVDWLAIESVWNRFAAKVEGEWGNAVHFLTGSLPAAGLAVAGLAVGLKRH